MTKVKEGFSRENLTVNPIPIVISGSGGSGTRVVAEILIRSGVYLGQDLNMANDDLLFTYLFKRPKRFIKDSNRANSEHNNLYALHEKLLFGYPPNRIEELGLLLQAGWDHAVHEEYYNWMWVIKRWRHIALSKRQICPDFWGWKEPHNMFYLRGIDAYYPDAKYIHVLRHGLDMVYSRNQQQLKNWGTCFQLAPGDLTPRNRFDFWCHSNQQTIAIAHEHFSSRFLVVKLEDLCLQKETTIQELFEFIDMDITNVPPDIWSIPKLPDSYQRYRNFDLSWVDSGVKIKLSELGYAY